MSDLDPRKIKIKRTVINVQSKDNACFAWSVIASASG